MDAAEPFDRALRRVRRDRAARGFARVAGPRAALIDEMVARLAERGERYAHALDLGCGDGALGRALPAARVTYLDAGAGFAREAGGVQADEDRLPFADASFDLIASAGVLQSVNDLPGCLAQCTRALKPGGLFVAAFPGGETLGALRLALIDAEEAVAGGVSARTHPMVDPREAAGLLQRAGFIDPVVDVDSLRLRYRALPALVADLRAGGETSLLAPHAASRRLFAAAAAAFEGGAEADGRSEVAVQILYLQARAKT